MNPLSESSPTLSVSQLNRDVKTLLESSFDYLWVEGEISNLAQPSSGHWYFSLKDDRAQVRCAMFSRNNARIRFKPANGDAIRLRARVSLYEGRGEFQLIVEFMEPAGAGALQARFDALRARLEAEGLFEAERKRPLPPTPGRIGVVTSATGAALHDILTVLQRRCPLIEVDLLPVPVQGEAAAPAICNAIAQANRWHQSGKCRLDALIVGRGGGSLEDLWAFNEESVARAIAASAIPVISAVGHEVDVTIADLVADRRAPTPSAAAEMVSPDQSEWLARLGQLDLGLVRSVGRRLRNAERELTHLHARLKHPGTALRERAQRLDDLEERLLRARAAAGRRAQQHVLSLRDRLLRRNPGPQLQRLALAVNGNEQRLKRGIAGRLGRDGERLGRLADLLDSLSPLAVLSRGYAIVSHSDGAVLGSVRDIEPGKALRARLRDGQLTLRVEGVEVAGKEARRG